VEGREIEKSPPPADDGKHSSPEISCLLHRFDNGGPSKEWPLSCSSHSILHRPKSRSPGKRAADPFGFFTDAPIFVLLIRLEPASLLSAPRSRDALHAHSASQFAYGAPIASLRVFRTL
jgi:hypothetical protein